MRGRTFLSWGLATAALPLTALLTSPLLARALEPAGRGALVAVLAPVGILALLCPVGTPALVTIAAAQGRNAMPLACRVSLLGCLLGVLPVLALVPSLSGRYPDAALLLQLALLTLPAQLLIILYRAKLQGQRRYRPLNAERWFTALLRLVLITGLFIADRLTLVAAVVVTVGAPLLGGAGLWLATRRSSRLRQRHDVGFRPFAGAAVRAWAGDVSSQLSARLDQALMPALTTPAQLGLYAVAVALAELPQQLTDTVRSVMFAEAAGGADGAHRIVRAVRGLVPLLVVTALALAAAGQVLVPVVYGSDFADALPMFHVLLLAVIPSSIAYMLSLSLLMLDRQGLFAVAATAAVVVSVPALFVVVPVLGGLGAALVSLAGYSLTCVITVAIVGRSLGLRWHEVVVPRRADVATVLALVRRRPSAA